MGTFAESDQLSVDARFWCPGFQELAWHAQLLREPVPEKNTSAELPLRPTSAHVATRARTSLPNECRLGFSFQQACYWGLSRRRLKVLSGPQQNVVLSEERLGPWALPTASEMSQQKLCESVLGTYPAGAGEVHESERAQLPLSKLAFRHAPAGMYGPHR